MTNYNGILIVQIKIICQKNNEDFFPHKPIQS